MQNLPPMPGVYLFKDAGGRVLYVGKALSLAQRVRSYLAGDSGHPRLEELMARATDLDVILADSEVDALLLERTLIRRHHPHFNILLKDDKSFPFVRVSVQEEFPRVSVTRHVREDGARYLGPYTDVKSLRRTLREIRRVFPLRTCRNFEAYRKVNRPCLYFHIRRCAGPCTSRARLAPGEYRALVDGFLQFLGGKDGDFEARLAREMDDASKTRDYERAGRRRDQLRLLEAARAPQVVERPRGRDTDVLGLARHGGRAAIVTLAVREGRVIGKTTRIVERAAGLDDAAVMAFAIAQQYLGETPPPPRLVGGTLPAELELGLEALARAAGGRVSFGVPQRGRERRLVLNAERNAAHALEDLDARTRGRRARFSPDVLELQRALGLLRPPHRVVCFDVSNLGGDQAVAAVVASEDGRPRKALYRRMRMRRPGPDDFAMIGEAVARYWTHVESEEIPRPDLVMVDGGVGQLRAARAALDRVATEPVPLIGIAKREESIVREAGPDLHLPRRSPALRALQRLRDEAHRFGLTYHRQLRTRSRLASGLDAVPGVGPARRAAVLKAFGSVAGLAGATPDDIVRRAGVPRPLAERIVAHLNALPRGDADTALDPDGRKGAA